LPQVLEEVHSVDVTEGGLAGLHAVEQVTPGTPLKRIEHQEQLRACRACHISAETRSKWSERKRLWGNLIKKADASEKAKDSN